jgi:hypothetical protein
MDPIQAFAVEASRFERWLLEGSDRDADAVGEALRRLLGLYGAALNLPSAWSDEVESSESARLGDGERQRAYRASQRIPLDLYGEVFNPTLVPPEEPVIGSIADDLADIYSEIAAGLRAYEQGNHAAAAWEWTFGLHSHWGAHATSAIRALHWWLAENAIDRLSSGRRAG